MSSSGFDSLCVEERAAGRWAVTPRGGGSSWNGSGFEYEPLPSSRTDGFLARTRFTRDEAIEIARKLGEKEGE